MALLSGSPRTATARSASEVELLEIGRKDFERLVAGDPVLARAVERLSHDRVLNNLSAGTSGAASWAAVASFRPPTIFGLWSTVLVAGTLAAAAGNRLIGGSFPRLTVFSEAVAGGAVLALVTHVMIPEAIEEAGSLIVLPTTAGFLAALYLTLSEYSV